MNLDQILVLVKVRRPPEVKLTLVPQKSMGGSARDEHPLSVKLHAKYTTDYPDTAPKLRLEDPQGLTSDQVKELEQEIRKLAKSKQGEVRKEGARREISLSEGGREVERKGRVENVG